MWVNCISPSNSQVFLLDIEKANVIGQLTNGWPVTFVRDQVLCVRPAGVQPGKTLRNALLRFVEWVSRGRYKFTPPQNTEVYWLLDLNKNAARKIGYIPNTPNFTFVPSPDFHSGYKAVFNQRMGSIVDYYYFDLQRRSIHKLDRHDWAAGWWDNSQILFQGTNYDFELYDVNRRTTSPFIAHSNVKKFLREKGVPEPLHASAFYVWNGRENLFYITDTHQRWLAEESFLIKVERPDGRFNLLSPNFKFEWSDHFDSSGGLYLHGALESGQGSDGVFVRDLLTRTNIVLVEPTSAKYHSIPQFYGDSVIYLRSNVLWRINLDASHNVRLFPPP